MIVDGFVGTVCNSNPSFDTTMLDAQISLMETPVSMPNMNDTFGGLESNSSLRSMDDFFREIVQGRRNECKEEELDLEIFLAKARAEEENMKMPLMSFNPIQQSRFEALDNVEGSIVGFRNRIKLIGGNGGSVARRGKSRQLDKIVQQRERRMIKNRESAARSRERKQAYQTKLESVSSLLKEQNDQLLKEKEERRKRRYKQLMEQVIPVMEKRRPARVLRRVHSFEW